MRHLWLFWFPLLFLPNLGQLLPTAFGTLEFSDFMIVPYVALVLLAAPWGERLNIGRLTPQMGLLVGWATLSTVTISLRYGYADNYFVQFGALKIAKLVLYGIAGILTARALARLDARDAFHWSLLGAGVVTGASLWGTQLGPEPDTVQASGYSATNGISVMAALLLSYIAGRVVVNGGSFRWRVAASATLIVIVAGSAVSSGRGGWVAAVAGASYLLLRLGPTRRILVLAAGAVIVVAVLYESQPEFQRQVDVTLFPVEEYGYQGTRNVGTVDDGARFQTWANEARKLSDAPVLGAGLFHRGGVSGLWTTGSHNYWLQMFLELGIVGGVLALAIVVTMWRQATRLQEIDRRADVPLKAALVAAFVGGLGGEYFYGGIILFTLLAVYAPTGGLPNLSRGRGKVRLARLPESGIDGQRVAPAGD